MRLAGACSADYDAQVLMTVGVVILRSVITCPQCGTAQTETMRTDACQFSYECTGCRIKLRPKNGDCRVFLLIRLCGLSAEAGGW
jgi:hypothetical protein